MSGRSDESWEAYYAEIAADSGRPRQGDRWLERWLPLVESRGSGWVLDLGCGDGHDAALLACRGLRVVAVDRAWTALRLARASAAGLARIDLESPLPFAPGRFAAVVASLSLHYFSQQRTQALAREVRDLLVPGGLLLARVNSTRDVEHGACGHPALESDFYDIDGWAKRFFDRSAINRLFETGWRAHGVEEQTVTRGERSKVLWEIVLEKT